MTSKEEFRSLKHPLQRKRFALALFFALLLFPIIGAFLVAGTVVLIVPLFALLLWMTGRVWYANFMGNSILVSELNYPRIHRIGEELKAAIGYSKTVDIFVYEQGNFNAFLAKFFFYRRAVFLNSELLEAGVTDDELRWLIGRFIGYLRARREAGFWGWTIRAAQHMLVFNLFLLPYERALVYSGDRIALAVIGGDLSSGISAMQKMLVGRQLGYSVNPSGLVDQHRLVKGSFFALVARLWIAFPHMTARYVDLIGFAEGRYPEQYARFEAENPGLPGDLSQLTTVPDVARPGGRDPVVVSLLAALLFVGLIGYTAVKVFDPGLFGHRSDVTGGSGFGLGFTPGSTPVSDSSSTAPASSTEPAQAPVVTEPQPYVSTPGRFSVQFPGTPKESEQQITLGDNNTSALHQFEYDDSNVSYLVMFNDFPASYVGGDSATTLEATENGTIESLKGTLISDQAIRLSDVPGRAFKFSDKDGTTYVARDFLDGTRLYQVIVTVGAGGSTSQADDFLKSFSIQ